MSVPPVAGLSLQQFVELSARMIGKSAPQCHAIAQQAGLAPWAWDAALREWTARLQGEGADQALAAEHRRMLIDALRRISSSTTPLDLDRYVAINVLVQTGTPAEQAFAAHGQDVQSFSAGSYEWIDRLAEDPRLGVYFQLRVRKGIAERSGRATRKDGEVYGPGNLVRGRQCHACGGLKATRPHTAYIYCDYCATLFDYDPWVAIADPTAMDPGIVDEQTARVCVDELRTAAASGDREAYADLVRWRSEVSTEICPAAYSPRVRDPAYRRRLIDEILVPWTVATRFDPEARQASLDVQDAQRRAEARPSLTAILELLAYSQRLWELEAALLEREGIFAAHPDGLDAGVYRYINASGFVRPWLAVLGQSDQQQLLAAAGVACEYVAMPAVDFAARSCGRCGQRWTIPADALRFMCESCGFVLDVRRRTFACAQCGGEVCLPSEDTDAHCGHCGTRWTV